MQKPIRLTGHSVILLDQRALPAEERLIECIDWSMVAQSITDMVVRGAPAIGITAAYGFVMGCQSAGSLMTREKLNALKEGLLNTRPTAVNLSWALNRMHSLALSVPQNGDWLARLEQEAVKIETEDRAMCAAMGTHGADFLGSCGAVLTHCNTGALATGGEGTALAIVREMHRRKPLTKVFVDETRPYLQGSRLTAWELVSDGLPACLITDSMAAWMMRSGGVEAVIVGADRIARNGDVANKIGTYGLAIACQYHSIPFVVAAPTSTIDIDCANGSDIEIEMRPVGEVKYLAGQLIAPESVDASNPSFDVTPNHLITAIVTEFGTIVRDEMQARLAEHQKQGQMIRS